MNKAAIITMQTPFNIKYLVSFQERAIHKLRQPNLAQIQPPTSTLRNTTMANVLVILTSSK